MGLTAGTKKKRFQRALLKWYSPGRRRFAWRDGKRNAYEILVAEVMLRKTDATKAAQVYLFFLHKYPDPERLSMAVESELKHDIRLLGIADRARLLKQMAQRIVKEHRGRVPLDFARLVRLPGVGPYTANAVLCFASHRGVPLVDTNVIRVLSRVFSFQSERQRARDDPKVWRFAASLVPKGKAITYNRALLDLGATICRRRDPQCPICPLRDICDYGRAKLWTLGGWYFQRFPACLKQSTQIRSSRFSSSFERNTEVYTLSNSR